MNAKLRINLLGPIYVEWEGVPVNISDFGSRKDLALLCFLVTEGVPLSRHYLASLFWHNKNERLGLNNLNRVLSQLRKLLPGCIQSDQYYVEFDPDIPVWSDVNAFVDLEADRNVESLTMAVSLYQGEFMAGFVLDSGFEFESWLTVQREKWVEKSAALLRQRNSNVSL
jgi:DNA-binding SARP family transcriptional activator